MVDDPQGEKYSNLTIDELRALLVFKDQLLRVMIIDLGVFQSYATLGFLMLERWPETEVARLARYRNTVDRMKLRFDDYEALILRDRPPAPITKKPLDILALVRDCVNKQRPAAEKADVSLTLDTPTDLPLIVGYKSRLTSALDGLLTMLIENAPAGGEIGIAMHPTRPDHEGDWVGVSVRVNNVPTFAAGVAQYWDRPAFIRISLNRKNVMFTLQIARESAKQHAGAFEFVCDDNERDITFFLWLPVVVD